MTGDSHYNVVMCSFDGEARAGEVLRKLKAEKLLEGREIEEGALVSRDAHGKVNFHERGGSGMGATWGAVTAGVVGWVGGPIVLLVMVVAGAVAGGLAGHFAGQILPGEDLRQLGESLPPGSSAYVVLVQRSHAEAVADILEAEGARIVNVPVETEVSSVIREAITHRVVRG